MKTKIHPLVMTVPSKGQGSGDDYRNCITEYSVCTTVSLPVGMELKMSPRIRILISLLAVSCAVSGQSEEESRAAEFLKRFDIEATAAIYSYSLASWAYNTNITKENSQKLVSLPACAIISRQHVPSCSPNVVVGFHPSSGRRGTGLEQLLHQHVRRVPKIWHNPDQEYRNQTAAHLPTRQRLRGLICG